MAFLRYCTDEGLLVGGRASLSADPAEYSNGCNRIWCSRCEVIVRSGPPSLRPNHDVFDARADLATLYGADDWRALPFLQKEPPDSGFATRLYTCKCTAWEERDVSYLVADPKEQASRLPWRCGGHPCPSLPISFGAFEVSDHTDWFQAIDRIANGLALEGAPPLVGPINKLIWLYHYLVGLPTADAFSAAIAGRLDDRDAIAMAAAFFVVYPHAKGVASLVSLVKAALLDPSSSRVPDDVVAMILERGGAVFLPDDLLWLATNIGEIDRRRPGGWMAVMKLLHDQLPTQNESEFLLVIAGTGAVESGRASVDQLRSWVAKQGGTQSAWSVALAPLLKDAQPDKPGAN